MANELKFTGVVGFISEITTGEDKNGKPYAKGYFIVGEPEGRVPNEIKVDWYNRNSAQSLQMWDEVEVFYNLKVKEYKEKHYQEINLWKINNLTRPNEAQEEQATTENRYAARRPITENSQSAASEEEDSGLPF